jgi:hypothetical protein
MVIQTMIQVMPIIQTMLRMKLRSDDNGDGGE